METVSLEKFCSILEGINRDYVWRDLNNKELLALYYGIEVIKEKGVEFNQEYLHELNNELYERDVVINVRNSTVYEKDGKPTPFFWFQINKLSKYAMVEFSSNSEVREYVIAMAKRILGNKPVCVSAINRIRDIRFSPKRLSDLVQNVVGDSHFYG